MLQVVTPLTFKYSNQHDFSLLFFFQCSQSLDGAKLGHEHDQGPIIVGLNVYIFQGCQKVINYYGMPLKVRMFFSCLNKINIFELRKPHTKCSLHI